MGCGIAACAASAGHPVIVVESSVEARQAGPERVRMLINELADSELISGEQAHKAHESVQFTSDLEVACGESFFVIEAIVEELKAKQELFQILDELLPPEALIVSNTSGLRITDIGALVKHKERIATAHFWFPAHIVPLVEVVMGDGTTLENAEAIRDLLKSWGKAPVIVRQDTPGQLANRILQAVIREASHIVEIGLASPEDVDTAVKMGMGIRMPIWGPLEHADGVGLDLCNKAQNSVLPAISTTQCANDMMKRLMEEGNLGYKTGMGFYDWSQKDMKKLEKQRNDFIIRAVKILRSYN